MPKESILSSQEFDIQFFWDGVVWMEYRCNVESFKCKFLVLFEKLKLNIYRLK
jgi:hypothetical protein